MLTIVADENIPAAEQTFSHLGRVITVEGRQLTAAQLIAWQADILLVRSVTRVDQRLLEGTTVRFVATATIGIDHLDCHYLSRQGIQWASAPGCNAHSVVDYVLSSFCQYKGLWQSLFAGGTVGIVGMGNVGGRLYDRLTAMGVHCQGYDPLLSQHDHRLSDFEHVLASDVICLHAPLTRLPEHPSYHMISASQLKALKPGAILLNAGRGAVIDNKALKKYLLDNNNVSVVLDVWEGEPSIDLELMACVDIATAHIAGYSFDGKMAGTAMIYDACCRFLHSEQRPLSLSADQLKLTVDPTLSDIQGLCYAVSAVYDVRQDDQLFRQTLLASDNPAKSFDDLRKHYPQRREFSCFQITNAQQLSAKLNHYLSGAGFKVD